MYSKLIIAIFILFNCELLFANEKFDNYTIRKYNEAVSYYNFGNYEKSMKIFKELYLDNPNSKIILNNYLSAANEYAMYLVNSLKYEQAIKVMEELSKIAPDKQEIIDNLGVIYLKIGNNYFKNQNYDS
ncbi:MAG TPA: tetratricopeptide repeat protein, partial [bacterium]|nr:tetratricopeptide repeat protein [bacterium]